MTKLDKNELEMLTVLDKWGMNFAILTTKERKNLITDIINSIEGHGWVSPDEVPDCDNCDERRGEPTPWGDLD